MHDLIGDIHGHADALERLLQQRGYSRQQGIYRQPERQAIFLGDFIDKGPQQAPRGLNVAGRAHGLARGALRRRTSGTTGGESPFSYHPLYSPLGGGVGRVAAGITCPPPSEASATLLRGFWVESHAAAHQYDVGVGNVGK
jgi:hypothetical protein